MEVNTVVDYTSGKTGDSDNHSRSSQEVRKAESEVVVNELTRGNTGTFFEPVPVYPVGPFLQDTGEIGSEGIHWRGFKGSCKYS